MFSRRVDPNAPSPETRTESAIGCIALLFLPAGIWIAVLGRIWLGVIVFGLAFVVIRVPAVLRRLTGKPPIFYSNGCRPDSPRKPE